MDNLVTTRLASLTEHHVLNQVNQTRKANKLPVLDNLDVIDKSEYQAADEFYFSRVRSSVRHEQEMKLFEDYKHLEHLYK